MGIIELCKFIVLKLKMNQLQELTLIVNSAIMSSAGKVSCKGLPNNEFLRKRKVTVEQKGRRHHKKLTSATNCDTIKARAVELAKTDKTASALMKKRYTPLSSGLGCFFVEKEEINRAYRQSLNGKNIYRKITGEFAHLDGMISSSQKQENALAKFKDKRLIDDNLKNIFYDLKNKKYQVSPYTAISLKQGKKSRILLVPSPRDRVVFRFILNRINKDFHSLLNEYNVFGSHKHKNFRTPKKILEAVKNTSLNSNYVVKIDIKKFFPSIDRELLINKIKDNINDNYILSLIKQSIDNDIKCVGKVNRKDIDLLRAHGIPQGCAYSPLLANIYALQIDRMLKNNPKVVESYRYLDDLIIFTNSWTHANDIFKQVYRISKNCLHMDIHELSDKRNGKSYISKTNESILYLGVEINNGNFFIPDNAIKKFKSRTEFLCNSKTIHEFGKRKVLRYTASYINGWKEFYQKICDTDYKNKKNRINAYLDKYYQRRFGRKIKSNKLYL